MTTKNLHQDAAVEKLRSIAKSIDFAMMCTDLSAKPFHTIPMSTKRVDEDGALWFLSSSDSNHNGHIESDSSVQLLYSHPGTMQFLTIFGSATVHRDRSILKELFGKSDEAWFDGVDDPKLTALKIAPADAHYWGPKSNKLVTLLKMGVGAITGEQPDLMDQGKLKV